METLENNNEDGPIIEYKEYQLDIILSFLSAIIGIRTSAFKSQGIQNLSEILNLIYS
jgi:hypothetical protein